MNQEIECSTQSDVDAALAAGDVPVLSGSARISVSTNCRLICNEGKPHVVARGSSQPHVVARGSSQPHVVAWGSSQPHVEAWESSQPHVVAKGQVQLHVLGSVAVVAAAAVAILVSGGSPSIEGGGFIQRVDCSTPEKWCEHYGVEVRGGFALLGKAIKDDYLSQKTTPAGDRISYAVGAMPEAPDWDGGDNECGNGLHFSPAPVMGLQFCTEATRFLVCPVRIEEMSVHPAGTYPNKCKAKRVALPIWEVTRRGEPVDQKSREIRDAFMAANGGESET